MKYIKTSIKNFLKEGKENLVDFDKFPKEALKTLIDEYFHYFKNNFDWNSKQDEFNTYSEFTDWVDENEKEEFLNNLNLLIRKTRQDLILIKKRKLSEKALEYFEELIKPTLGNEVLTDVLSVYLQNVILNPNLNIRELDKEYENTKKIIDSDGNLNQDKLTQSKIFTGENINLPNFERFVEKNPEYRGVFDDWKKLFDKDIELTLKSLNAFRNSTSYNSIKKLYDFLIDYKKSL